MTTVGYFEMKSMKHAKNHRKMHHLYMFSKTGSAEYKANHMFQVATVGQRTLLIAAVMKTIPVNLATVWEPKVIRIITEQTIGRTRSDCFYYPYH
ncbi:hypothetical protein AB4K20DRAFT_1895118 [Rhizopus microsporus]